MTNYSRIAWIAAAALTVSVALTVPAACQSQDDSAQSVAEAARKAKERKKAAAKEGKVITEDELKLRPASADASGAPPAGTVETTNAATTPADASAAPADAAKAPDATAKKKTSDEKEKAAQAAEVAKTKELLAQAQEALDLLKRKMALDSDSFYSNPDHARDTDGKSKLDDLQNLIGDKQMSVDDLKSKLADLMQKAGISPDADKTSTPPQK